MARCISLYNTTVTKQLLSTKFRNVMTLIITNRVETTRGESTSAITILNILFFYCFILISYGFSAESRLYFTETLTVSDETAVVI